MTKEQEERLKELYEKTPYTLTPVKAIRRKCLQCCCGSAHEVSLCSVVGCALYDYRLGHRPKKDQRKPREK